MIDIHTHILPGIDDGVKTEDEAVEFARVALADGVRTIVATPHCKEGFYFNDRHIVLERVARMGAVLRESGLDVDLLPGAEVHLCPDLVARVRDGRAPTLADNGKTLLLELSLTQYPVELGNLVFELKLAGLIVVFAHPERIRYFQDDVRRYEEVVRLGAYGQITTGSIVGTFGETVRKFSEDLLSRRLVHVLASDAHNVRGRPPRMQAARDAAARLVGVEFAMQMATTIPRSLVAGEEPVLPDFEPPPPPHRGSFLSRLFKRR